MMSPATKRRTRRPSVDREGLEQTAFFNWLRVRYPQAHAAAFHPPNGGSRVGGGREGARLKAQGVKAGVCDIFIELARGGYYGFRCEFKATPPHDASVQPSQRAWLDLENTQGYYAVLCTGLDALIAEVEWYLSLPETEVRGERAVRA